MMRAFAILLLLLPASAGARPLIYGFTMPSWWKDAYSKPDASRSLRQMAGTGAKWVAVVPTLYQKTGRDSAVERTDQTASDDSVRGFIRQARAMGLHVALKPHVNTLDNGFLAPDDPRAWWRSYDDAIVGYARLAQDEGVELFVIGTELCPAMTGPVYHYDWLELIRRVRAVYHGKITFAAHFYDFAAVDFWGQLDYIGVDGYFPMPGGSNKKVLEASWRAAYLPALKLFSAAYGKPLLFTEFGISSQKGANREPWAYDDFGPADPRTQKAYFEAFIDVFKDQPFFAGFFQWCWSLNPDDGGPADKSMTVQGKPALDTLESYFGQLNAPAAKPLGPGAAGRVTPFLKIPGAW